MILSEKQKIIVESNDKKVVVNCSAASGKTTTLIERIKYLLGNGVVPNKIVAITFTNAAAEEIKERIAKAIAKEIAEYKTSVEYDSHNMTMMTDFYEMTMGQVNFNNGYKDVVEYYDEFFRKEPLNAGYGVVAGLDQVIQYIEHLHFTDEDIDFLRKQNKFSEEYLDYLRVHALAGETQLLEINTAKQSGSVAGTYEAVKYDILITINEWLGEDATISYDIDYSNPVIGTATISNGVPTFTEASE